MKTKQPRRRPPPRGSVEAVAATAPELPSRPRLPQPYLPPYRLNRGDSRCRRRNRRVSHEPARLTPAYARGSDLVGSCGFT